MRLRTMPVTFGLATLTSLGACGGGSDGAAGGAGGGVVLTLAFGAPVVRVAGQMGANAQIVLVANVDQDADVDVAVANTSDNQVGVFLNDGSGVFQNQATYATDTGPLGLGAGLFNGDAALDLVSANTNNSASFLPNSGALGVFNAKLDVALTNTPTGVAVGDFDGDGDLDAVFPNVLGGLKFARNTAFTFAVQDVPGNAKMTTPKGALAADFTGDGRPDVAVADAGGDRAVVWVNSGNAVTPFSSAEANNTLALPVGSMPQGIAAGDLDGDGRFDVVVPNPGNNSKSVTVFRNTGAGTFTPGVTFPGGSDSFQAAVADFNLDGKLDVVVLDFLGGNIAILLGKGDGTLEAERLFTVGKDGANATILPRSVAVGDFNGDLKPDVVVASDLNKVIVILLNTSS